MKALIMAVLLFVPLSVAAHSPVEFLDLIDETKESVVHVITTPIPGSVSKLPSISPKEEPDTPQPDGPARHSGTGFFVEGGYIVTNHHVIENYESILIYFENDPQSYQVEVIGSDAAIDIAILKPIGKFSAKPLQWRTEDLRVGEEVWALGHPGGLVYSVSKGIVSHLDRRVVSPWQPTIQTDAAINQGNSGGPLLDMDGKVVGINVMILSRVSENNGLALAIDGGVAARATNAIIANGKIERPLMGVMLKYDAEVFRVKAEDVGGGGPASLAGIENNDYYLEIDGEEIFEVNDVFDVLAMKKPGDHVLVTIMRGAEIITYDVILGKAG